MTSITKWDKQAIVKAIMADVPKPDKKKRREKLQAEVVKLMSPECRKVYKLTPRALATCHVGDYVYDEYDWSTRNIICGDVSEKKISELIQPFKDEDAVYVDTRNNLRCAIEACRTIKQLNDRLPEFKKYFPTVEKPINTLPALANVVADLTKLGWPKGEKK